jgi:hypothetical protein
MRPFHRKYLCVTVLVYRGSRACLMGNAVRQGMLYKEWTVRLSLCQGSWHQAESQALGGVRSNK